MTSLRSTLPRVLLFTGNGKGKTTAALGTALRAAGHGQRVLFVQFLKAQDSTGEIAAARHLPGVELVQTGRGFVPPRTHTDYATHRSAAQAGLAMVEHAVGERASAAGLVVLDEVCTAISLGLLEVEEVLMVVAKAQPGTNVILTGRDAPDALIAAADTVTDMHCVKHALGAGCGADPGVEW
jgi:cob(I)alamin adenosyltransferase